MTHLSTRCRAVHSSGAACGRPRGHLGLHLATDGDLTLAWSEVTS
jgi:hypothetical protein